MLKLDITFLLTVKTWINKWKQSPPSLKEHSPLTNGSTGLLCDANEVTTTTTPTVQSSKPLIDELNEVQQTKDDDREDELFSEEKMEKISQAERLSFDALVDVLLAGVDDERGRVGELIIFFISWLFSCFD